MPTRTASNASPRRNNLLVMQPTTYCNLNCSYCYLPDRRQQFLMQPVIAQRVARYLECQEARTTVLWHGGEPLCSGVTHLSTLVREFEGHRTAERCRHSVQTNATLVNEEWCAFFRKYDFHIGVSIDGEMHHNAGRRNWSGRPAFDKIIDGIQCLKRNGLKFAIIAVVNKHNIADAAPFYRFLADLEPSSISVNIEEVEGFNSHADPLPREQVQVFWDELLNAWITDPRVPIQRFQEILIVMDAIARGMKVTDDSRRYLFPTIDCHGNVVLLSPELISAPPAERRKFVIGNLMDSDLSTLMKNAEANWYVAEFRTGIEECRRNCDYFDFCHGAQASNKYFECGRFDVSETRFCRNARIAPVNSLMKYLERHEIELEAINDRTQPTEPRDIFSHQN